MNPSLLLNNPALNNISPEKLQFLMEMAGRQQTGSPKDMVSSLMSASADAQSRGVGFDSTEMDLIIEVLKQNMSENERKRTDMILSMVKSRKK